LIKGLITKIESKDFYVLTDQNITYRCSLRGKFKNEFALKKDKLYLTNIATVGDTVEFESTNSNGGVIHSVEDRKNYISRKAPKIKGASYRGERLEQIIAANVDQIIVISSVHLPEFNNKTLDRFLVTAESAHIKSVVAINKSDLITNDEIKEWADLYEEIGYPVFVTSAVTKNGMEELSRILPNKITLFWGQSGVGKSTLLNILFPQLNLKVGDISESTGKGVHTTVTSIMIPVDENTLIIDTPGVREIDPYGIKKEDLSHYFLDFEEYLSKCKFNTCTHYHEPGCGVMDAVEKGEIAFERYDSYLRMLDTIEEDLHF
jgi:ribosome biogenesis GTPase